MQMLVNGLRMDVYVATSKYANIWLITLNLYIVIVVLRVRMVVC
jgi:hypothetical protein